MISLPQIALTAGESKVIDASDAIRRSGIRGLGTAGLEFSYSSAPGSMIMSALSLSSSENHVFRVLLMDAASLPSSAGTYPWSITDESSTVVYIKNVTNEDQDFIMVVRYGAVTDGYAPRAQTIAPAQTMAIDLRRLRNEQVPDGYGRTLPLDASGGQLHWAASGRTRLPLIGRGEQVSILRGMSMTAACGELCCGDVFMGSFLSPGGVTGVVGDVTNFTANQQEQDCYGNMFTYPASAPVFSSSNPAVATCDSNGTATGVSPGTAIITATWHYFTNYPGGDPQTPQCFNEEYETQADATCDVVCAVPTNFHQVGSGTDNGGTLTFVYQWESNTGNLNHLSQCTVGEIVTYPDGDPFHWPNPPFNQSSANPTVIDFSATSGMGTDNHSGPNNFVRPYSPTSFFATQFYRYRCPCSNGGNYVNLVGSISIVRSVGQNPDGTWRYTITKSGSSATISPLP